MMITPPRGARWSITGSRLRTDPFAEDELTRDAFLGGRLEILQPGQGYRAGIDPVLLAAAAPAREYDTLLDLGCGSGVAALCVAARVPGVELWGLECQPAYADLARRNAARAGIAMQVATGDIAAIPATLRQRQFDHVIVNPPWFDRTRSDAAHEPGRETALGEARALADWMAAAMRRCAPGGHVCVIHRAERLADMLAALAGSIEVLPLVPRRGRAARLVLIRARKGGRAALKLCDGWLLHHGVRHARDADGYTEATAAILRDAVPLPFHR